MANAQLVGPQSGVAAFRAAFQVPWNAFVAAFLYYTLLTLLAIGVADLPVLFVTVAYLLPPAAYIGLLISRAIQALAALPIDIGETPHALQH